MIGEETKKLPTKVDLNTQVGQEVVSKTIYKDSVRQYASVLAFGLLTIPANTGNGCGARQEGHQEVLPGRPRRL